MSKLMERSLSTSVSSDQLRMPLFEALINYAKQDVTPFDVPGHKMGAQMTPFKQVIGEMAMRMDVNSMKELDLLSHPQSVIKEAQALAADAFGAEHAFFLVNGTTIGIQAMIMAACKPGDKLIVPRNAHKSVMDGIILTGVIPVFIQPEIDQNFNIAHGVSIDQVKDALKKHPDSKALLIAHPTYFGTMSELKEICDAAKEWDIPVLVDGAHGAHLAFLPDRLDALTAGADAVTVSMHKTGGSLTQSSMLLLNSNKLKASSMQKAIGMLQTTSANYLLMASLDAARRELVLHGSERYIALKPIVEQLIVDIEHIPGYRVLKHSYVQDVFKQSHDWTKLVIRVSELGMTGFELYTELKESYGIQMELAEGYVVMAVITNADNEQSLGRLLSALKNIARHAKKDKMRAVAASLPEQLNELAMLPRDAFYAEHEMVAVEEAIGRISADTLMIYPPGIPLVIPGEVVSTEVVKQYQYYLDVYGNVLSESDQTGHLAVVKGECK